MKKTIVVKTALFLIVFGLVLSVVYKALVAPNDYRIWQWINGFYDEKKDSHDAVYIGASIAYATWESPIGWHNYGIAVYPFTVGGMPFEAIPYMVKEARKTQPNALYIININHIPDTISDMQIHWTTDYMAFSKNRIDLINHLCDIRKTPFSKRFEFYFPLIRFHSRWNELRKDDFHYVNNGLKGGSVYGGFTDVSVNVTSNLGFTTSRANLPKSIKESLEDLLNYFDAEGVRVLFITSPQTKINEDYWAKINTINDYVQSRGYPYLNLLNYIEEIGLDLTTDYYNGDHTNIHGALKTTKFLAEYLAKNYGFKDKRGNHQYSYWDEAYDKYMEAITPYVLDIETNYEKRDYTLPAPKLNNVAVNGTTLTVSWEAAKGAKGYRVYRKEENSAWNMIGAVDGDTLRYTDKNCTTDKTYTYTVVPWHMANGEKAWGRFNVNGVKAKARLNVPGSISVNKVDNGVKVTWKKVKGADGYDVFKRLPNKQTWIRLHDAGNTNSYIDTEVPDNLPFVYMVRGYILDKEKKKIDGSFNPNGPLYLPELTMPTVETAVNNGEVTLSWNAAEGMNGYKVYRNEELIADLPAGSTEFTEKEKSSTDTYRVEAYFKVGSVIYTFNLVNVR